MSPPADSTYPYLAFASPGWLVVSAVFCSNHQTTVGRASLSPNRQHPPFGRHWASNRPKGRSTWHR